MAGGEVGGVAEGAQVGGAEMGDMEVGEEEVGEEAEEVEEGEGRTTRMVLKPLQPAMRR